MSNSFSTAFHNAGNMVEGDNGALKNKSSNNSHLDCFTNFNKDTSVENIKLGISKMISDVNSMDSKDKGEGIVDIFKIWCHKRHAREGEKEKLLSYRYFLELYEIYPETCIKIASSSIFGIIGYWKDPLLIWKMINNMTMDINEKFEKYDQLIKAFRASMIKQRHEDLKKLSDFIKPQKLGTISCNDLEALLKEKASHGEHLSISYVGKFCVREKSPVNNELYWYTKDNDGKLVKEPHVSYFVRGTLKRKVLDKDGNKTYEKFPVNVSVPFGAKKDYRTLNSRLNVVLEVPEVYACSKRFGDMDPSKFPSLFILTISSEPKFIVIFFGFSRH